MRGSGPNRFSDSIVLAQPLSSLAPGSEPGKETKKMGQDPGS